MKAVDAFTRALQLNGGCVGALIGLGNFIPETLREISGNLTRMLSEGICDFTFFECFSNAHFTAKKFQNVTNVKSNKVI